MAFTDYKNINAFQADYKDIVFNIEDFIPNNLEKIDVPVHLREDIKFNILTFKSNEYLVSENFISPLLRTVWKPYSGTINYWSHQGIKYDEVLIGVPDFLFTHLEGKQYQTFSYPIVSIVEAKAENFTEGWAQCAAQMLACQKLNEKEDVTIFGIVTTGRAWEFARMKGNIIEKHTTTFYIEYLDDLMNVLNYILAEAAKQFN
jgi:hypothetical protein